MTRMSVPETGAALSQVAYERIRQDIFDCRYDAGDRLREREVSEAMQMSRIPVREAFPRLETGGLIRMDGRRGAIVTHITTEGVHELYDLRGVIEPFVARMAADRITPASGDRLLAALGQAEDALASGDVSAFDEANSAIHRTIGDVTHSDLLERTVAPLADRTARLSSVTLAADPQDRHREHRVLVSAIVGGNRDLAASAAFTHVELGRERTLAALATHPHFLPPGSSMPRRREVPRLAGGGARLS